MRRARWQRHRWADLAAALAVVAVALLVFWLFPSPATLVAN
jgi:hypothetical protein